jgi:hypothetical protein
MIDRKYIWNSIYVNVKLMDNLIAIDFNFGTLEVCHIWKVANK